MARPFLTRRRFLEATGWTAAGVTALYVGGRHVRSMIMSIDVPNEGSGEAWIQILPDGGCRMFCPRAEMGQNSSIGLAQIAAEELNIAVESIDLRLPSSEDIPQVAITAGSVSLAAFSEPTARAAAVLRETLRERAGARGGVGAGSVEDAEGGFMLPGGERVTYGELAAGKAVALDIDRVPDAPLYSFDPERRYRQIGRPAAPHQIEAIVTGAPVYASDVRMPGMSFGRAARPPVRNARLAAIDEANAAGVAGLVKVVVDRGRDFVGVVCETPGAATTALDKLDLRWELPGPIDPEAMESLVDVDAALARGDLEHTPLDGRIGSGATWDVDLRFDVQLQSHAMQEPRAAVARFSGERLEIWTGSQDHFKGRTADEFDSFSEFVGLEENRGLAWGGLIWDPGTNFHGGVYAGVVPDLGGRAYGEMGYGRGLSGGWDGRIDGQFTYQFDIGDDLLGDLAEDTWFFAIRAAASRAGAVFRLGVGFSGPNASTDYYGSTAF